MSVTFQNLEADWLQRELVKQSGFAAAVEVVDKTDSTNAQLRQQSASAHNKFLIAREQTSGVGRRGGHWQSPPSGNLYLSYCFHTKRSLAELTLMPLAFAVEIADCLEAAFQIELKIKWPNDIYLQGKKCGGILLETKALDHGDTAVIAGVGLNVISHPGESLLGRPTTSLQAHCDSPVAVSQVAACVMKALATTVNAQAGSVSTKLLEAWPKRDLLWNQPIEASALGSSTGIAKGICSDGGLRVEVDGKIETLFAGDVTLGHIEERLEQ